MVGPGQARPQPPQFLTSLAVAVSQPSSGAGAAGWLQLALPLTQLELHTPPAQASVATPAAEQLRPQAPQLAVEVLTLVSQPSVLAPVLTQSPKPPAQV